MKKNIENTLTEKQKRGLAILQQEPELFNELISEAIIDNEEKRCLPPNVY